MIDRNIGRPERFLRFGLGTLILLWVFASETFGLLQGIACLIVFALYWNSVFGRCYLWKWLGITTCREGSEHCPAPRRRDGTRA